MNITKNTIKEYLPVPKDALILGENQYRSRDSLETQLNNHVLVVGTSGAGKTRYIVRPNLLQATGSYVVSDPKGSLFKTMGPYLQEKGYEVVVMDFIHPETSLRYNPLAYCKTTQDIQKLAHTLVYELTTGGGGGKGGYGGHSYDPFWDQATNLLLMALIGFILETDTIRQEDKTLNMLPRLVCLATRNEGGLGDANAKSPLDKIMKKHLETMEAKGLSSWAYERYEEFNTAPNKTHATINITTTAKLITFGSKEVRKMLSANDLDFKRIGQKKTALFVQVSDTDRSMDVLVNLFYTQLMNELCSYADEECENSCLPVEVQFILDDFATNARIDNFENMISNIRSRGISAMLMIQSEAQLKAGYGENAQTIIDNCNTYVYMGGMNPGMAEVIAMRANKPAAQILNMPISHSWIFRRGEKPVLCHNFDLEWFENEVGFKPECSKTKPQKRKTKQVKDFELEQV